MAVSTQPDASESERIQEVRRDCEVGGERWLRGKERKL
jgi:hypothetical protein